MQLGTVECCRWAINGWVRCRGQVGGGRECSLGGGASGGVGMGVAGVSKWEGKGRSKGVFDLCFYLNGGGSWTYGDGPEEC